jgi:hypothetical protein
VRRLPPAVAAIAPLLVVDHQPDLGELAQVVAGLAAVGAEPLRELRGGRRAVHAQEGQQARAVWVRFFGVPCDTGEAIAGSGYQNGVTALCGAWTAHGHRGPPGRM